MNSIPDDTHQRMLREWRSGAGFPRKPLPRTTLRFLDYSLCEWTWCVWARETYAFACAANEEFWEHEWQCHGTCSGFSLPDYFTNAIEAYEQCDQVGMHACTTCMLHNVMMFDPPCPPLYVQAWTWPLHVSAVC